MCAYKNGEQYLLYLPFDFDDETDLRNPWNDGKELFNYCVDEGYETWLGCSGNKGFHVYIKTEPKVYTNRQISRSQSYFIDKLNLKTFDYKIHGDVSRLMRIMWTWNPNGGWCRLIAYNKGKPLDLDNIADRETSEDNYHRRNYQEKYIYNKACIEFLIKDKDYWIKHHDRHVFEPSEPVRITWACMRLWRGDSIDDIVEEGYNYGWKDRDKEKIRMKVEYLDGREYTPYGCEKLKELGYCIPEVYCKWRNNIEEDLEYLEIL